MQNIIRIFIWFERVQCIQQEIPETALQFEINSDYLLAPGHTSVSVIGRDSFKYLSNCSIISLTPILREAELPMSK